MATREHLTCDTVAAKLREFNGNMAAAARSLKVDRSAVAHYVERHPTLKDVLKECRESMKDHAESSLQRALLAGEAWAVCFYLKCQAKERGYVERQEVTGADDAPPIRFSLEQAVAELQRSKRDPVPHTNGTGRHPPGT
jgi:hypothetical protein